MTETRETAASIAARHDRIRKILPVRDPRDRLVLTSTVAAEPHEVVIEILLLVRDFSDFNEDNDPWKEHDYGRVKTKDGREWLWKFTDYDGAEGIRCALTIMHPSDY